MVKGPLVPAWVQDYLDTIEQEVTQYGKNNEILWAHFESTLDDAYKDTNEEDDTITKLEYLEMKKGNLLQYIVDFNLLRKKAGCVIWATVVSAQHFCYCLPSLFSICLVRLAFTAVDGVLGPSVSFSPLQVSYYHCLWSIQSHSLHCSPLGPL
jgi:hypothetical protein